MNRVLFVLLIFSIIIVFVLLYKNSPNQCNEFQPAMHQNAVTVGKDEDSLYNSSPDQQAEPTKDGKVRKYEDRSVSITTEQQVASTKGNVISGKQPLLREKMHGYFEDLWKAVMQK